jgi:hypothetical protein
MILRITVIIPLDSIDRQVFVIKSQCASYEGGTEFLNIT